MCDRRRDLRGIASKVGISFGTVQSILNDILGMSKFLAKWVPRTLTDDQERTLLAISRYLLSRNEDDRGDFIKRVVTQGETYVHHFDPASKLQSKQWKHPGSPPLKKFKRVHPAGKVMTSIFWDSQGMIMIDCLEQGRTIKEANYAGELRWLRREISRKRQGKLTCGVLVLCTHITSFHDCCMNADSKSFLIPHILLIWYMFPKLKSPLRGTQYGSNEGVKVTVNEYLGDQENALYFEGIRMLKQRWAKCIALKVDYIEK